MARQLDQLRALDLGDWFADDIDVPRFANTTIWNDDGAGSYRDSFGLVARTDAACGAPLARGRSGHPTAGNARRARPARWAASRAVPASPASPRRRGARARQLPPIPPRPRMVKARIKLDFCAAMKEAMDIDNFVTCLDQVQDIMDDCAARYGPAQ